MRYVLTLLLCSWFCCAATARDTHSINAVAGDESFVQRFGRMPNLFDDPTLRIYTHLHWVEEKLRAVSTADLTNDQRMHRTYLLDQLHQYAEAGRFPKNKKFENETRPCFIDDEGSICAVGYLIEQSAGRSLSEKINSEYQYAFIADMHDAELSKWIAWSGLSAEECALIQPSYIRWYSASYEYGNDSLIHYLQKNMSAGDSTAQATVSFYVDSNGVPRDFKCTGNAAMTKNAERLLKKINFQPGGPGMMWNSRGDKEAERKRDRYTLHFRGVADENEVQTGIPATGLQKADTSLQSITLKGTVMDQMTMEALPFCTVALYSGKTMLQSASTDLDGNYKFILNKYQPDLQLLVQYMGYEKQLFINIPWNNQSINIMMKAQRDFDTRDDLSNVGEIRLPVK